MDGIINVYKNLDMTSFDVVKKVKKSAHMKKVGHTGTLDPKATGVLPVALGKATKIIDYIMNDDKSYFVKFKLGITTDTYDLEGTILEEKDISDLSNEEIFKVCMSFKKEYMQVPPMYSALKKDGVRLYELARQGIEIEREGRKVNILDIQNIIIEKPYVSMEVTCSKGTYIRSLCYDIGEVLNVGATVVELERTKTSCFKKEDSINIDELNKDNISKYLIYIEDALHKYPKLYVNEKFSKLLLNGVKISDKGLYNDSIDFNVLYRVYDNKRKFIGLGKKFKGYFKIEKLLV